MAVLVRCATQPKITLPPKCRRRRYASVLSHRGDSWVAHAAPANTESALVRQFVYGEHPMGLCGSGVSPSTPSPSAMQEGIPGGAVQGGGYRRRDRPVFTREPEGMAITEHSP